MPTGFFDAKPLTPAADADADNNSNNDNANAHVLPTGFFEDQKKEAAVRGTKTLAEQKAIDIEKEFEIFKEDIRADLEVECWLILA